MPVTLECCLATVLPWSPLILQFISLPEPLLPRCSQTSSSSSVPRLQLASQLEEAMLQVVRQLEVSVDSAVAVLTRGFPSGAGTTSDAVDQQASLPGHCFKERPCCMQRLAHASTISSPRSALPPAKFAAECKLTWLQAAKQDAAELIDEVYQVVADNYLDARDGGFDKSRCVRSAASPLLAAGPG